MSLTTALLSFALVAGLMTLTPGLDTALVLRTAAREGRRAAGAAALGINAGVLAWAVVAAVGVSVLVAASQLAYTLLRWSGAAYMVWLGLGMLYAAWRGQPHREPARAPERRGAIGYFRQGLLVNLMNPKVGAFYVALLPQVVPEGEPSLLVGVLMGLVHNLEGALWFGLLILAVHRFRTLLQRPTTQRCIDGVAGATVVALGVRLGLSR